jgi:V/A-type H+-transporting ATPase subunit I
MTINVFTGVLSSFVQEGLTSMICCGVIALIGIVFVLHLSKKKGKIIKYLGVLFLLVGGLGVVNLQLAFYIFLAIFLVVAHLGNSVLQALGSFVHSLRLQYVEFFGMFYEAGGKNFKPFKEDREYTICENVRGVE